MRRGCGRFVQLSHGVLLQEHLGKLRHAMMRPQLVAWLLISTMTNERTESGDVIGFERALQAEERALRKLDASETAIVWQEACDPD